MVAEDGKSTAAGRLIADAILIRDYLAAGGLLGDSALDDALGAVAEAQTPSARASALAILRKAVSDAVNVANPYISLVELRAGKSPFAQGRMARLRQIVQPILVAAFALVAICGTVLGFAVVQDVNQDLTALHEILVQEPLEKLSDLKKLVTEGALKNPKSSYYSQYEHAASNLTLLFETANEIVNRTMFAVADKGPESAGLLTKIFSVLRTEIVGATRPSPQQFRSGGDVPPILSSGTV